LTGWWQHRFWVVASLTAAAGIYGLQTGRASGVQPLVAGLLAALGAGYLALELARVMAFVGGGSVAGLLVKTFLPTLHEPLLAFLAGGLLAVLLFRLWMLALTSLIGMMVMTYTALAMLGRWTLMDSSAIVSAKVGLLNGVVISGMLAGIVAQSKFDKWRTTRGSRMKAKVLSGLSEEERNALKKAAVAKGGTFGKFFKPKKAG
jgi:K+-sensing histidine kinase KdpD